MASLVCAQLDGDTPIGPRSNTRLWVNLNSLSRGQLLPRRILATCVFSRVKCSTVPRSSTYSTRVLRAYPPALPNAGARHSTLSNALRKSETRYSTLSNAFRQSGPHSTTLQSPLRQSATHSTTLQSPLRKSGTRSTSIRGQGVCSVDTDVRMNRLCLNTALSPCVCVALFATSRAPSGEVAVVVIIFRRVVRMGCSSITLVSEFCTVGSCSESEIPLMGNKVGVRFQTPDVRTDTQIPHPGNREFAMEKLRDTDSSDTVKRRARYLIVRLQSRPEVKEYAQGIAQKPRHTERAH
jgi:hypothetical protein